MIAESDDIKFACAQCGQRIIVEKAAAGITANCPICKGPVTVPHVSSLPERRACSGGRNGESERSSFADPGMDEMREELFQSVADHGQTQRELDEAGKEIERLRGLVKKVTEECERMTANATHAQAEIKSFQSDRQQLKIELSQTRQRALSAENQVAELAAALAAAGQESNVFREQITSELAARHERLSVVETQLAARERELAVAQVESSEVVQSLAGAQSELASASADLNVLRTELKTAQQLLDEAADSEERLVTAKQALQARLDEATAENQRLGQERHELREQAELLRHDLGATEGGQELLDLRGRVRDLTDGQARTAALLVEKTAEAETLATTGPALRAELEEARSFGEDAERRALASSESQMKKDNDVLRGIVARQNTTLGVYYVEVRRMRRCRYALRLAYGLFALGLLAVVFFAVAVFSHQGIGEFFRPLFH